MTTPTDVETSLRDQFAEWFGLARNGPASDGRGWYRTDEDRHACYLLADGILAALADRLMPEGKSHEYWQVVYRDSTGRKFVWSSAWPIKPNACLARARSAGWPDASLERRTITTYPDGSQLIGPWTPEGTDG